jgi:threonine synthase
MRDVWLNQDRLICPHTANAYYSAKQYQIDNPENTKSILVSETASPWKFLASIATALTCESKDKMKETYEELRKLENTSEGKDKLLQMIQEAYEKNGKDFDENMIPEDLREIYKNGVKKYDVFSAKQF